MKPTKAIWRGTNAIESWSWENCNGNNAEVEVYSDAYSVELLINEKPIGKKKLNQFKAIFKTRYIEGKIIAIAFDESNKEISRSQLVSATGKTQIKMTLEEQEIKVNDIAYIQIDLVGENEIIKANSDKLLSISVEGGKFIALGSADPCTEERFDSGNYTTYYGQAFAVVYADKSGKIIISACS